jgi:hypothetical protein
VTKSEVSAHLARTLVPNSTVVRSSATRRSARYPEIRDCIGQKICGRFVAESAAKRHFSATDGANVPNETLVSLRRILPVFVLLAPYGNPGSTLKDRRSALQSKSSPGSCCKSG